MYFLSYFFFFITTLNKHENYSTSLRKTWFVDGKKHRYPEEGESGYLYRVVLLLTLSSGNSRLPSHGKKPIMSQNIPESLWVNGETSLPSMVLTFVPICGPANLFPFLSLLYVGANMIIFTHQAL